MLHVGALRRLWAEVDNGGVLLYGAHEGLEHQVEASRCGEAPLAVGADQPELRDHVGFCKLRRGERVGSRKFIQSVATLAGGALNERITE